MSRRAPASRTPGALREARASIDDPAIVMEAAATFLAVRPRSVEETRRRLRHLGYRHELVDRVAARLVEMGYLDDATFARAWVESRDRSRPRGENALRRELALKGVPREVIDEVLNERMQQRSSSTGERTGDGADEAAAQRLLERKSAALAREPDRRRRLQKAYALLARSGFDPEVCASSSRSFVDGSPSSEQPID